MPEGSLFVLLQCVTLLGCALVAGVFFAFSSFVMGALGKTPPATGIAAMQSINRVVINVSFMTLLFGTALLCVGLGAVAILAWDRPGSALTLLGAIAYVVGTIGVTIIFNVPRNDALAVVEPGSAEGERVWTAYLSQWTAWNHVRTLAATVAAGLLLAALVVR